QYFGLDGRQYALEITKRQLVELGDSGKTTVIAEGFHGNDFAIAQNGNIYLTESGFKTEDKNQVWLIKPTSDGKYEKKVIDATPKFPNGITLSPDQSLLYVADYKSHWVYSYQIQPDGTVTNGQRFYDLYVPDAFDDAAADGIRCDTDGRLYVT